MKWLDAARARLWLLAARRGAESRMNQEFHLHIELEAARLMREDGHTPDEARRLALVAFGGVEKHKEALREERGFAWLSSFAVDLRLAIRMLARYPGLTIVGCAAMAFGIGAAVGVFEIRTQLVAPSLPLDQGSRIVGFRNYDASLNRPVLATPYDFTTWRDALTSIADLSGAMVLLHRGVRASDVAPQVGFYDQAQLTRHFTRLVGTTPARYGKSPHDRNYYSVSHLSRPQ